ncbi:MAG: isoquinoline 1-oxidoreductase subunit beta, partial [Pseudomonadota bacterium]|nr:isoquinoline 1-oxidoreductase subunit beta [Pseudomonadota bacterium]
VIGITDDSVRLHTTLLGGGFGRRLEQDYVLQAVEIAQQTGLPIKLIWSRSEDTQHDFYRPFTSHRLEADLDAQGNILSWRHRVVGPSHGRSTGGAHLPYLIPHYRLDYHVKKISVPIGSWRSIGSSHNAFVTECFMDELAHTAGVDAYQFRRKMLQDHPRILAVLDKAVELAGWGKKLAPGNGMGMAMHDKFGSIICMIAEASVVAKEPRIKQLICVVDCGMVVNPDIVTAQIEGGIAFGLTAAIHSRISISKGRVTQSNFHDFPLLALREMPEVQVHLIPSDQPPGGIGEVGVPPVAPAVANAIFAATGKRFYAIPMLFS